MRRIILLFLLLVTSFSLSSQAVYRIGTLPSINLNKKYKKDWSANTRIESRQLFRSGIVNGEVTDNYRYVLNDFSFIGAKKVGLNSRIAIGYLLRVEGQTLIHRSIQQYTIVQRLSGFRLAHRFVSDQTFSPVEAPEFRLRYRVSTELPFNGESVDPKEFYLKFNNEYVNGWQGGGYDLEVRIIPILGYHASVKVKVEAGLDYRIDSFVAGFPRHSYWTAFNLFVDI